MGVDLACAPPHTDGQNCHWQCLLGLAHARPNKHGLPLPNLVMLLHVFIWEGEGNSRVIGSIIMVTHFDQISCNNHMQRGMLHNDI